jgi:proteasome component ECM29
MTEIQIEKSLEERRKDVENDLSSLSRVSHRLAMLDTTEKLSQVLDKLLPRLLNRIGENHQRQLVESSLNEPLSRTHSKLVEMLSHTMKRVREDKRCQLPCRGILDLLVEESSTGSLVLKGNVDTFTLNLSLAFLTLGINRCPEWEELVPGLLVLHGFFSSLSPDKLLLAPSTKSQWHQVTHLLFRAMDNIMRVEEETMKNHPSSFSNTNAGKRLKPSATTDPTEPLSNVDCPLTNIRALLAKDETAACACYDLLLDLILYQTVPANSSVPPPGLSQAAHLRLSGGPSESARDWCAEMAPRNQLVQMKSRVLDWIAPSRRWGLFMMSSSGKIRSLALLMSAAGDPTPEVSQKASIYLKQVLDAQRDDTDVYGDPILLIQELLILCVGASNAQLVLSKQSGDSNLPTLGISREVSSEGINPQTVLSLKRRMVADSTFATLIDYAAKVLVDVPQSFDDDSVSNSRLSGFGSLAILACNKTLSQLRSSSGLTMLRAKSYIAAAQLLNALVVRLSTMKTPHESRTVLLSKSMGIACDCLSTIVASKSSLPSPSAINSSGSEGNTAVRDALYGTICILSRSGLSPEKMSWLFAKGNLSLSSLSAETATLLFGCIAAEEEVLRPRAVAALDALLAAYCRLVSSNKHEVTMTNNRETLKSSSQVVENPWGQMPTSQVETQATENNILGYVQKSELSKLLLPLLWTAAQHSQPNQSRVAAARWASDLLSLLDLTSACHILCFLAGDSDVTASTLARNALAAVKVSKNEENLPAKPLGDFSEMIAVIFTDTSTPTANSWRPSFWEFTPKGKTATVEYLLQCLLHDIYGGDDEAMRVFVLAVSTSILEASSQARREFLGLLDECAGALSLCLFTSPFARSIISSGNVPLKPRKIQELSLHCTSSKARRLLAESWGHLYSDTLMYENNVWAETIEMAMQSCCEIMEGNSSTGEKHGAGFLGGTCIKLYRQQTTLHNPRSMADLASKYVLYTMCLPHFFVQRT